MKNSDRIGRWSEGIAKWILRLKGYHILHHRFKTSVGEIDLIARRGKTLIAVEVKYRQNLQDALESIQRPQQFRIAKALSLYIKKLPWHPETIRFDVICIAPGQWPHHLQNAW